ncbi:TPA: hypothetical protein BOS_9837 [Bos taurus]|nr:TPA: hypothetical protein BOS_9837 [Bos taurus]
MSKRHSKHKRSSTGILPWSPEEEVGLLLLLLPPPRRLLLPEGKFFPGRGRRSPGKSSPASERQASSSLAQPPCPSSPSTNTDDESDSLPKVSHCEIHGFWKPSRTGKTKN